MQYWFVNGLGFRSMVKEVVSPTLWMCWALTSVGVALAGPFGTFGSNPFLWRLVYWSALIAVAIIIAIFFRAVWRQILLGKSETREDIAVAVSLSIVFAPLGIVLNWVVGGDGAYQVMGVWSAMACVLAIAAGTIAFRRAVRDSLVFPSGSPTRDRLLGRLPVDENVRLVRIYSDNHHVRVVTSDGSEHRLLMRLRDAVTEIDVEPGFCVHRSHWVSRTMIAGVTQAEGREVVELACGGTIPIGPKYRANLIDAGIITA